VSDYYERTGNRGPSDSLRWASEEDVRNEIEVAAILGPAWNCEICPFGQLSPVDWYARRNGLLVAGLEIKARNHVRGEYPDVYLNVRKWLALMLLEVGMGVPSYFVVRWKDQIGFVNVPEIDGRLFSIAGCTKRVKSDSDIEPVIHVSIDLFSTLEAQP
jgi:hypothetical protein